jgi:FdhD protein
MEPLSIIKIDGDRRTEVEDPITPEVPFTVTLNGKELVTLLCSPSDLRELAVGFLFTAGIVRAAGDVRDVSIDRMSWAAQVTLSRDYPTDLVFKRVYTAGCGRGVMFYEAADLLHRTVITSAFSLPPAAIHAALKEFQSRSAEYRLTGGTHSAALGAGGGLLHFMEDIGRHNALDKALGAALMAGTPLDRCAIYSSGRISSEIVLKVLKTGAPIVVTRGAPTDQAVRHARAANLTLVGFARGARMNVYSAPGRIT